MPKYLEVELSTGETVKVYHSPTLKIHEELYKVPEFQDPEPPVETVETVSGPKTYILVDDPEYKAKLAEVEERRNERVSELSLRAHLRDIQVPDGFDVEDEVGFIARLTNPSWEPRTDNLGPWLDYVEWVLLANSIDSLAIQEATIELAGIDLESVRRIEDSFPSEVEGETA